MEGMNVGMPKMNLCRGRVVQTASGRKDSEDRSWNGEACLNTRSTWHWGALRRHVHQGSMQLNERC